MTQSSVKANKKEINKRLAAALRYAQRGWKVFPLHYPTNGSCSCRKQTCSSVGKHPLTQHGVKDANTDEDKIHEWWMKWPKANIGIATGRVSGIVVLDIDPRHGGDTSLKALMKKYGKLPETVESLTGGGGRHIYFLHPGKEIKVRNKVGLGELYPGLDIRGDGGYIVAPPSLHASGEQYVFKSSCDLRDKELASIPDFLLNIISAEKQINEIDRIVPGQIIEGQRNIILTSLAGTLRVQGLKQCEILNVLKSINKQKCSSPLPLSEIRQIVKSICNYPMDFHLTDSGNAERLVYTFGRNIHFCHVWGKWLIWNGNRWEVDQTGGINRIAKECVREICHEAYLPNKTMKRDDILRHASKSESATRRKAMIELAKSEPDVPVKTDKIDTNPWLLNVLNGTIDLKNGKLKPHNRDDLITKIAPVVYDKKAKFPAWLSFLNRIMEGNQDIISFLQKSIGWALTGDISEQVFFILYGTGANGKSTFLNIIGKMLGDYSLHTPTETLMVNNRYQIPTDIARLKGARLVTAVEVETGKRFAESLVKQVTGGDKVTARFLHQDFFEFIPEFKLFLATNHKPAIRGGDHAIWRRIRLIPFDVTIHPEEQDKELPKKLENELPGILRWAVDGCLEWQNKGLEPPMVIKTATANYEDEMDMLKNFLDECVEFDENSEVKSKILYEEYKRWSEANGENVLSQRYLGLRLADKGLVKKRKRDGIYWCGMDLY